MIAHFIYLLMTVFQYSNIYYVVYEVIRCTMLLYLKGEEGEGIEVELRN